MGFSRSEYEDKPHKAHEYIEGTKAHQQLGKTEKSVQEMMAGEDTVEDTNLAANVGSENLIISTTISSSDDAASAADVN